MRFLGSYSNAEQHKRLFEYVRTRKDFLKCNPHTKQRAVDTFVEFLYKVRNNMFHSVKEWDEPSEALFLTRVNPILKDLLKGLIRAES